MKILFALFYLLLGTAALAQAQEQQTVDRFKIVPTSQGVFLIDTITGCVWSRSDFSGLNVWTNEFRTDDDGGKCTLSSSRFMEQLNAISKSKARQ
jgi:hypothetical protein